MWFHSIRKMLSWCKRHAAAPHRFLKPGRGSKRRPRKNHGRLWLEGLEDRTMPAIVFTPHFPGESVTPDSPHEAIQSPPTFFIFWGSYWTTPQGSKNYDKYVNVARDLLDSSFLQGTQQYGGDGKAVFGGSWIDGNDPQPGFSNDDANAQVQLAIDVPGTGIASPLALDHTPIYVVVTPPTPDVAGGGGWNGRGSYSTYIPGLGEFSFATRIAIVRTNNDNGKDSNPDQFSVLLSHEFAESVTNMIVINRPIDLPDAIKGDTQISDNEPNGVYRYRLTGYPVQAYWSQDACAFVVTDGNAQTFTLDPIWNGSTFSGKYNLTVNGDQMMGDPNDHILVNEDAAGGLRLTMNGETVSFDPGEIVAVNINTLTGNDTVDVERVPAGSHVNLTTGTGHKEIDLSGLNHDLRNLPGDVFVTGNGEDTTLVVNDQLSMAAHTYYLDSSSFSAFGTFEMVYHGVTNLQVHTSTGANTLTVAPFNESLDGLPRVSIDGGGHTALTIDDLGINPGFLATYTVTKSSLTRSAFFHPTVEIDYSHLGSLTVNAGNATNTLDVESTPAPTTVNGGTRSNAINVSYAGHNLDPIGTLTIHGGSKATLTVDDQANPDQQVTDYTVTSTGVTRVAHFQKSIWSPDDQTTATINCDHLQSLTINTGSYSNFEYVYSTVKGTPVRINAGTGSNQFTVGDTSGSVKHVHSAVILTGNGATSTLLVDDGMAATQDRVTVNPIQVVSNAPGTFFASGGSLLYFQIGGLTLNASSGQDDLVNVIPSATTAVTVNGSLSAFQAGHPAVLLIDQTGVKNAKNMPGAPGSGTWTFGNRQSVTYSNMAVPVADVTAQVAVAFVNIVYNPLGHVYHETVTLTNTGSSPIVGPLSLVLDHLNSKVHLQGKAGTTLMHSPLGSPYVNVVPPDNVLDPGQSMTVYLDFAAPNVKSITYQARVLAGTGNR
jgi:hypothetical protein